MRKGSLHLIDYSYGGSTYSIHLFAEDWADAEARLRALKITGKVVGSDLQVVHVNSLTLPVGWLWARLSTWWRNL